MTSRRATSVAEKLTLAADNTHPAKKKDKLSQQELILKTLEDLDSAFTNSMSSVLTNAAVAQKQLHSLAELTLLQGVEEILGQNPDDGGSGGHGSDHKHRGNHGHRHGHKHGHKHGLKQGEEW